MILFLVCYIRNEGSGDNLRLVFSNEQSVRSDDTRKLYRTPNLLI